MGGLARHLEREGLNVRCWDYASRKRTMSQLADDLVEYVESVSEEAGLWAVSHSLGGILVRLTVERINWRGVVMLAPPNQGSAVARWCQDRFWYKRLFGPAGQAMAEPSHWPSPPQPCGVIAGKGGISISNPASIIARKVMPQSDQYLCDGTLTVDETRCIGVEDHVTIEASHTWIMNHPETKRLVCHYITQGCFPSS
jgi:hypothetical protein